jgi:hypothetical protein
MQQCLGQSFISYNYCVMKGNNVDYAITDPFGSVCQGSEKPIGYWSWMDPKG